MSQSVCKDEQSLGRLCSKPKSAYLQLLSRGGCEQGQAVSTSAELLSCDSPCKQGKKKPHCQFREHLSCRSWCLSRSTPLQERQRAHPTWHKRSSKSWGRLHPGQVEQPISIHSPTTQPITLVSNVSALMCMGFHFGESDHADGQLPRRLYTITQKHKGLDA